MWQVIHDWSALTLWTPPQAVPVAPLSLKVHQDWLHPYIGQPAQTPLDGDLHLIVQRALPPGAWDHLGDHDGQTGVRVPATPALHEVEQWSDNLAIGRADDGHLHVAATPRAPEAARFLVGVAGGEVDDGHVAADRQRAVNRPRGRQIAMVGGDDHAPARIGTPA